MALAVLILVQITAARAADGPAPASQQRRVLSSVHTDAVSVFAENGRLVLGTKADVDGNLGVRLDPNRTIFNVEEVTRTTVPELPSFSFLGASGSTVWIAPESNPGGTALWPGFSTEGIPAGAVDGNQLVLRLESVSGPGTLHIFQNDVFGNPIRRFSSTGSEHRAWTLQRGMHAHAAWAFSAAGRYTLTFSASALTNGVSISTTQSYAFVVGNVPEPVATTVTLAASTNSNVQGSALSFQSIVTPANAVGWVEFRDGTTVLGHDAVNAGSAALTTTNLQIGARSVTARFVPQWLNDFAPSTSAPLTVAVGTAVRATFEKSAEIKGVADLVDTRLADIDNDGDMDVLYAKRITAITILPSNGNGTFGAEIALPALTTSEIHVADVNGDNRPDIVSSVYLDSTYADTAVAIWRNLGAGGFSGMELVESTRTTGYVFLTGVGDVDRDGLKDIVFEANGHSWTRNQGGVAFGPRTTISTGGGINYSAVLRDIDQDGDPDIVQASFENDVFRLLLFRNSGTAIPSFPAEQLASFGSVAIGDIAIGDTSQDGFADIHLIRRASTSEVLVLKGTATGAFSAPVTLGSAPDLTELQIGDIDGDGRPDLALSARDRNQILFAQNLGAGAFTELQEFTSDGAYLNPGPEYVAVGDIDGDGRNDLVYGERFGNRVAWSRNRSEEDITALTPPAPRTYLNGYPMTFDVFLGFNVKVHTAGGSPTLPVTVGSQVIQVPFAGQPNANVLRFRHLVQPSNLDVDGITVATQVALNGAAFTDVHGRPIDPSLVHFPAVDTSGVRVNGGAPYVTSILRLDANPAASPSVRFEVAFSEPVTGVTVDDFELDASGPTGAAITTVTGSGSSYIITASTGSGDGTLRLRVLDDDSIVDAASYQLGGVGVGTGEFAYGQGYTVRNSTTNPTFNNVITDGHLDISLLLYEGAWYPYWNGEGFWDATDTHLSAGPDARAKRPADPKWDFLGVAAGETLWIFPETQSGTTPWPGVGAYDNTPGAFATYFEDDPRINGTAAWLKMQLVGVRGPEGGHFSLYQSGIANPVVFMATADGIGANDVAWIPNLDHIHYNWAFTKPGLYQVDLVASGYIDFNQTGTFEPGVDPLSESQIFTLYFGVELMPTITGAGAFAAGQTVTLTRQLPSGVTTPFTTHRWERKSAGTTTFITVAGATNELITFAATLADDAAEYRVSILKPDGTIAYGPSPVATLKVRPPVAFTVTLLGLTNSAGDSASKINNQGRITGTVDGTDGVSRGYLFDTTSRQELERAGYDNSAFTEWGGVNSSGQLAGYYADPADPTFATYRAFVRSAAGTYAAINWSGDPDFGLTVDMDEHGRVAGGGKNTAWVWNPDGTFTVFNVPGFTVNGAFGMNDHGIVVGAAWPGLFDTPHGLIYNLTNKTATIWNYPGAAQTTLYGINNQGDIVGEFKPDLTSANIPFVRWADGSTQVLSFRGLAGVRVYDINDNGVVVGRYKDAANKNRSFYARPDRFANAHRYTLGHGDVRAYYEAGALRIRYQMDGVVDGLPANAASFPVDELVTVLAKGSLEMPDISGDPNLAWLSFIGVPAGAPMWVIPESGNEAEELQSPWLGYNTEELTREAWVGGKLEIELVSVVGPPGAHFSSANSLDIGQPLKPHFATSDGIGPEDRYKANPQGSATGLATATHSHVNWYFTRPGRYEITLRFTGTHVSDGAKEARATLLFEVPNSEPVLSLARGDAGSLMLSFPTEAGANYILQRREQLGPAGWVDVELIPGTGQLVRRPASTTASTGFYRVMVD